jgi:hypothetical protein
MKRRINVVLPTISIQLHTDADHVTIESLRSAIINKLFGDDFYNFLDEYCSDWNALIINIQGWGTRQIWRGINGNTK